MYWLTLSTGIGKDVLHKSIIVKNLFPVGIDVGSVGEVGTTGFQVITMMFIEWRSLKNLHPWSLSFSPVK